MKTRNKYNPFKLLIWTALYMFMAEIIVMFLVDLFPHFPRFVESLIDAGLLILFSLPILYMFLYRPLNLYVSQKEEAESELQKSHMRLEEIVKNRTTEIEEKNVQLTEEINERQHIENELLEQVTLLSLGAEIGSALTIANELGEMLQKCCESIVKQLRVSFARVWTLNPEGTLLQIKASAGLYTNLDGAHSLKPVDNSNKIGRIALTQKSHLTNSVIGDPQVLDQEWAKREGMVAFAGHPLMVEDKVVGVMALFSKHSLSDITLKALASVADQIALGIERKKSENAFHKVNRALRVLSKCSEILVHAQDEQSFLNDVCSIVIELGGYHLAWIGFAVDDKEKTVSPVAYSGHTDNYLENLKVTWSDTETGQGPTGTAIRTGKTVSCKDTLTDPKFAPWKDKAKQYGYRSSISLPLIHEGRVVGALNIYSTEANAFDQDELKLLEELAKDIAYGIFVLRTQTLQIKGEKEKKELHKQIRQMQKMQAIGTLAGGIAHDFNNLLTPIMGFANLLQYRLEISDPQAKESLEQIVRAASRAKELVKQILTFSRQAEHERKPLLIHLIVKEAVKLLKSTIPSNINIQENIQSECGTIFADATEIHQLVMNLCTNAYHAMLEKGGEMGIHLEAVHVDTSLASTSPRLSEGEYVKLTIKDSGCGMTQETLERIFEPFFTTKPQGEGTGMGLAVVHGVVESLNGAIIVESKQGEGSTFQVFLPLLSHAATEQKITDFDLSMGKKEQILFVDDNESVARLGQNALEMLGYKVVVRTSSTEAFELFKAKPDTFDLIITDQMMPNLVGTELTRKIINIRPNLPVILITGFSHNLLPEDAKKIGIRKLVMKPLIISELSRIVREVLDEK